MIQDTTSRYLLPAMLHPCPVLAVCQGARFDFMSQDVSTYMPGGRALRGRSSAKMNELFSCETNCTPCFVSEPASHSSVACSGFATCASEAPVETRSSTCKDNEGHAGLRVEHCSSATARLLQGAPGNHDSRGTAMPHTRGILHLETK